jgi:hypothetical protein
MTAWTIQGTAPYLRPLVSRYERRSRGSVYSVRYLEHVLGPVAAGHQPSVA